MSTYTVRTIADGDHYFDPRDFGSLYVAEAFYSSTESRIRREDNPGVEITVDLIDNRTDDVIYSTTFPQRVWA